MAAKRRGTRIPMLYLSTLFRWLREGQERSDLSHMLVLWDPLQHSHAPIYFKYTESLAKRFRAFFNISTFVPVEFYALDEKAMKEEQWDRVRASPRYRLESIGRNHVALGLTWEEVERLREVTGRGNK